MCTSLAIGTCVHFADNTQHAYDHSRDMTQQSGFDLYVVYVRLVKSLNRPLTNRLLAPG